MDEEEFEAALRLEFLTEAGELLDEVESAFLELEKGCKSSDTIDSIFRMAHTLKGGALTVGLNEFGAFAHTFENLLMKIRNNEIDPDSEVIDVLLLGNDKLKEFTENPNTHVDATEVSAKLDFHAAGGSKVPVVAEPAASVIPESAGGFLNETPEDAAGAVAPTKPAQEAPLIKASPAALKPPALKLTKPTVLICDDNLDILELLEEIVSDLDINVVTAPDPIEALKILSSQKIDTIYTDLNMPKMSGIEFIEKVRETDPSLPVIFCSGFAGRDEIAKFIELGAYAFIDKPIERENVEVTIKNALKMKRLNDGVKQLSALNFNAYINMMKLMQMFDAGKIDEAKGIRDKLETKLDEISSFTNALLKQSK